ncbi:5894_t:CDS:1 [Acaulospora colombiana]|uniref:5894_t:CDS:1 n=1 Tax=Acaulospora colombiana TaxID=27376 RepID=A0ACA9M3Z7_9GLOM|nr:5894_t:CDS:1 [Acaulospora colombiana]
MVTTVSTRSIALFFSNDGVIRVKDIHNHSHGDEKVFVQIDPKNIKEFRNIYICNDSKDDKKKESTFEEYAVEYTKELNYIYLKNKKTEVYYYVATTMESVYLCSIKNHENPDKRVEKIGWFKWLRRMCRSSDNIKVLNLEKEIYDLGISDECRVEKCSKLRRGVIEKILDSLSGLGKGGDEINEETEKEDKDEFERMKNIIKEKLEVMKIENPDVLVDILDTGFLNYVIYYHRRKKAELTCKKNYANV